MSLNENLVAFWKLDEGDGAARADSVGSNELSDNNSVTQADGRVGGGAQFTAANSESLNIADNTDMSTGDIDFTWSGWVYFDSLPTSGNQMNIAGKYRSSTEQREWGVQYDGTDSTFDFFVSDDGTSGAHLTVLADTNHGVPALATWIFIVVWHDSVNNTLNMQINNGGIDSVAYTAGVFDGTQDFELGSINATAFFNGRIDAAGWWKRVLTIVERTQLYNQGNGIEPPFLTSAYSEPVTVVTQVCDSDTGFIKEMILPRFGGDVNDENSITKFLDEQAQILEDKYNTQVARSVPCDICVTSGAIILDCGKCVHFEVAADADINSISFINCFEGDQLNILFRASRDVCLSGWPDNLTCPDCGDVTDCNEIPSGSVFTKDVVFSRGGNPVQRSGGGGTGILGGTPEINPGPLTGGGGSGGPTGTCPCVPDGENLLTVVVCTEFNCDDSEPKLELTACGGTPPYTWSVVGGETPTQTDSGLDDRNTKIEPPTNDTPGEPGNAYARGHGETRMPACIIQWQFGAVYDCSGTRTGSCTNRPPSEIGDMPIVCEHTSSPPTISCRDGVGSQCGYACVDDGGCEPCEQRTVDLRTAQMITNGCKPCAAVMEGTIVSVTDAVGAVVSTVIRT